MEGDDDERREDKCENLQLYCRKVTLSLSLSRDKLSTSSCSTSFVSFGFTRTMRQAYKIIY
jgi:hypothetical protein